ncbi:MAG: VWA domain-containing protein [Pyrinomonadaceae bacterium MAG19_C2-C3]|nr:VWA domain-containing protein [Pyrinomonadaceae bacterium MAG19_C2-C3]
MNSRSLIAFSLILSFLTTAFAQQTVPQNRDDTGDDSVVEITTNLVQIDAVVTDKNGDPVTDLTAADFEIYEDDKPQPITNFSFVSLASAAPVNSATATNSTAKIADKKSLPPAPSFRVRADEARRTIAFVASDLSLLSAGATREALKKYVDEMMQPNDLVGIFRVSGGGAALQQFTADKRQLYRAIQKVRFLPMAFGPGADVFDNAKSDYTIKAPTSIGVGQGVFEDETTRRNRENSDNTIADIFANRTLGVLFFLINDLQKLPGRKALVLFSDGIPVANSPRSRDALRRLIDLANRASVTIYTMDARGLLIPSGITAADDVLPDDTGSLRERRRASVFDSRNGLNFLAEETGGLFRYDANDLSIGIRRVLRDQSGYYLIGYRPSSETFARATDKFRRIKVRVKRPGLTVRARSGFYGVTEKPVQQKTRTGDKQLYAVLASPLAADDVRLRLTSQYGKPPVGEAFTQALLYINPQDITFTDEADGQKKLSLDVAAVTFRNDSKIVDEFTRTHTVRLNNESYRFIAQNGLAYAIDVPTKQAGAYQLRVVVRDNNSGRIGSTSEFMDVPQFEQNRIALSSLFLRELQDAQTVITTGKTDVNQALAPIASASAPALRQFKSGATLTYGYWIYGAAARNDAGKPRQLTAQLRLFREGELLVTGQEEKVAAQQSDPNKFDDFGLFKLNPNATRGDYTLQIVVNETAANGKHETVAQSIDFTVVP